MTDGSTPAEKISGTAIQSGRRAIATFGLWAFGTIAILSSLISLTLLIVVPLFSLENELWDRGDNPHTLANVVVYAVIGVTAIFAARSSDRARLWLGVTAFVVLAVYGLYDFGLFHS